MPPVDTQGNPAPYTFDKDTGAPFDPPIIPDYERRIGEAQALADDDLIATITEEYHAARLKMAKAHNARLNGDDEGKPLGKMNKGELRARADEVGAEWSDEDTNDDLRAKIEAAS